MKQYSNRSLRNMKYAGLGAKSYVFVILIIMYLPVIAVIVNSFNSGESGIWKGFSLEWYQKLFNNRNISEALTNSLNIAALSCLSAAVIGTIGAVGMVNSRFKGLNVLETISVLPIMIPEIILALAYLAFFTIVRVPMGIPATVFAHTTFCIPYVLINVKGRLANMDPALAEAARDLGASTKRVFLTITLPLIFPGIVSGTVLALAMSLDDVIISLFLADSTMNTLPVYVYSMLKVKVTPEINALCTLMLAAVFIVMLIYTVIRIILRAIRRSSLKQPSG